MTPRFKSGDQVSVSSRDQDGHIRTPNYVRGRAGEIQRVCGSFPNPELVARGALGLPYVTLYRVSFRQTSIWPDYSGDDGDCLVVDLYEHWLDAKDP